MSASATRLLKTTDESEHERQPFTPRRPDLDRRRRPRGRPPRPVPKLKAHGHEDLSPDATDVELILRAYPTWGENCVEHLLGDFAFAIWDAPQQRLFCARDHLGVKPFFFYSTRALGQKLIFSSSLDCIRQHPAVSDRLNDLAIADFLLFDLNQDLATTSFADIQRLPPAHAAIWSAAGTQLRRYWTLPIDEPALLPQIRRLCGPLPRVARPGSKRPPAHPQNRSHDERRPRFADPGRNGKQASARPLSRLRSARLHQRARWT